MSEVILRRATPADIPAMSRLIQQAIRQRNSADYTPEIVERSCANFTEERLLPRLTERAVFVAVADGRPIGTVGFANGKLYSLFVEPGFDRRGLGTRLVAHIEGHAAASGIAELRLSAALPARLFYEKLGYHAAAFEDRPDGSTWLMLKRLPVATA